VGRINSIAHLFPDQFPKENSQKNKVQKNGTFFTPKKPPVTTPRLPRIPPQLHHQKTTAKTRISLKHPPKTPIKPQ
jgi:hypothetical protein